jgi:hypothetical protein
MLLRNGRIEAIGAFTAPPDALVLDLDGLLVAPGVIDADRSLVGDFLPPILPGPFVDRARREAAIEAKPRDSVIRSAGVAVATRCRAAQLSLLKEGATCVVSAVRPPDSDLAVRVADGKWIEAPREERNLARLIDKAGSAPVFLRAADGDSRDCRRDIAWLNDTGALRPNVIVLGGVGLSVADAEKLAESGAWLAWRPVSDRFVLGRTVDPLVLAVDGLKLLIGAGARRDGGQGVLFALREADHLGYIGRRRLLAAATADAGRALGLAIGRTEVGALADLAIWRGTSLEEVLFEGHQKSAELAIVGGKVVFCRGEWWKKLKEPAWLKEIRGDPGAYCVIDDAECFT